jgi:hypothetical protein
LEEEDEDTTGAERPGRYFAERASEGKRSSTQAQRAAIVEEEDEDTAGAERPGRFFAERASEGKRSSAQAQRAAIVLSFRVVSFPRRRLAGHWHGCQWPASLRNY